MEGVKPLTGPSSLRNPSVTFTELHTEIFRSFNIHPETFENKMLIISHDETDILKRQATCCSMRLRNRVSSIAFIETFSFHISLSKCPGRYGDGLHCLDRSDHSTLMITAKPTEFKSHLTLFIFHSSFFIHHFSFYHCSFIIYHFSYFHVHLSFFIYLLSFFIYFRYFAMLYAAKTEDDF